MIEPVVPARIRLEKGATMNTKGYHILVVDDDPDILWVTTPAPTGETYPTTPALGGETAIKALEQSKHDLVPTDLNMPGTDGGLAEKYKFQY